jgi:hypothetical protein
VVGIWLTSNNGTTDLLGRNFGHVQDDNGGDETDTKTGNDTTSNHDTETSGRSLKDATNSENGASENDGKSTSDEISEVTSDNGTEKGTVAC